MFGTSSPPARRRPLLPGAALCGLLLLPGPAFAGDAIAIVVYNGLGTTAGAWLSGRALQDKGLQEPRKTDSKARKAWRMYRALESDEVPGVGLTIDVAGKKLHARTDDEGLFDLQIRGPLPVGTHPVKVTVSSPRHKRWRALPGALAVFPARAATVVISDFDDTVVATHVTNKARMVKRLLTTSALDLSPFPGAAAEYRAYRRKGWPVVFVSGSPINLYTRIDRFLRGNRFPVAPLFLKRLGRKDTDDALFAHEAYKIGRIERVMALLPGYRVLLIGDSGERDPEVYRAIQRKYPGRVHAIRIHNVTGEQRDAARFAGQTVFRWGKR